MTNTHDIAKRLGRKKMGDALGIGLKTISKYVVMGKFPSSWFLVVREMCAATEIDCPVELFDMKEPPSRASTASGAAKASHQ